MADAHSIKTRLLTAAQKLGEPQQHCAENDRGRDLRFRGWLIAEGRAGSGGTSGHSADWNRGITVWVYLTVGGQWVLQTRQWSQWQGEGQRDAATKIPGTIDALQQALTDDECGEFRRAEKEAWEETCRALKLADLMDEHVE